MNACCMRSIALVVALVSFSRAVSAQYAGLDVGVRARVQTLSHPTWSYGRVISYDTTGILLEPCVACEGKHIPHAHILRLQASAGRTGRSHGLEGFLVGAIAGGVVGHAIVQRTGGWPGHNEMGSCVRSCAATVGGVSGALVGGFVGFTTGAFLRRETWDPVYVYDSRLH
jgi:hypothetical protein